MDANLHRTLGDAAVTASLRHRVSGHLRELKRLALTGRELCQGPRGVQAIAEIAIIVVQPRWQGHVQGWSAAQKIDTAMSHDGEHPRPEGSAGVVGVTRIVQREQAFLHAIFEVRRFAEATAQKTLDDVGQLVQELFVGVAIPLLGGTHQSRPPSFIVVAFRFLNWHGPGSAPSEIPAWDRAGACRFPYRDQREPMV